MTIDRTTFDAPFQIRAATGPRAYVAVVSGEASPAIVDLPRGAEITIGRSRSSALCVLDGSVSRTHASLRWDGGGTVTLTDYGSRNGTLADGRRVAGEERLASGTELTIGPARLVVVVGGGAGAEAGLDAVEDEMLVARDPSMLRALALVERAARSDATVLIAGETGSGKEVVARRIHALSRRRAGPFVAVNCGAIPESLAEAALFGHERGAFTGAVDRRAGVFEQASTGTLFLDEVGELSSASQARLLRAIADRTVMRVGGTELVPVDVRLVAATNRDLDEMVEEGKFRSDLLYRLDVVRIAVPPLRDRVLDVEPLAHRFLAELAGPTVRFASDAIAELSAYGWPGNVRELRNVIERAVATRHDDVIRAADLSFGVGSGRPSSTAGLQRKVEDAEREAILGALRDCNGNQSQAAKRLGISRRALIYRLEKLGLKPRPPSWQD